MIGCITENAHKWNIFQELFEKIASVVSQINSKSRKSRKFEVAEIFSVQECGNYSLENVQIDIAYGEKVDINPCHRRFSCIRGILIILYLTFTQFHSVKMIALV